MIQMNVCAVTCINCVEAESERDEHTIPESGIQGMPELQWLQDTMRECVCVHIDMSRSTL